MIRIVISCIAILSTIFYCVWEKNKANTIMKENCIEVYTLNENQRKLIIENSEIEFLNLKTNELRIDYYKNKQILKLENISNHTSFEIFVNKKFVLKGSFFTGFGAKRCFGNVLNYMPYLDFKAVKKRFPEAERRLSLNEILFLRNTETETLIPIYFKKEYPELYQAFKNTNRLIE